MAKEKANYEPSAAARDLEERQERGNENPNTVLSTYGPREDEEAEAGLDEGARDFTVEGNEVENYLDTDPVYQNYGIDTLEPLRADGGPEEAVEAVAYGEEGVYERPDDAEGDQVEDDGADGEGGTQSGDAQPAPTKPSQPSSDDTK